MSLLGADLDLAGLTAEELSFVRVGLAREWIGTRMEEVALRASRTLSCGEDGSGVAVARTRSASGRRAEKRIFGVVFLERQGLFNDFFLFCFLVRYRSRKC